MQGAYAGSVVGLLLALTLFLVSVQAKSAINFNFAGILGYRETPVEDVETFDYIIVGAGAAGCVLARRLAEDEETSVLVLEAGGEPDQYEDMMRRIPRYQLNEALKNPTFSKPGFTEPSQNIFNRRLSQYQGQGLGGTTNIYSSIIARPQLQEIDAWEWPGLNSSVALEYYKKAESHPRGGPLRGENGPITIQVDTQEQSHIYSSYVLAAAANVGFPTPEDLEDGYNSIGVGYTQRLLRQGERINFCEAYLPQEFRTSRPLLHLRTSSHVHQVLINNATKAYGVQYIQHGKTERKAHAQKEIILSAGTFSSPQLLMLSGVGPRSKLEDLSIHVKKDLPGVGKNYMERPRIQIAFAGVLSDPAANLSIVYSEAAINEWLATRQGPLSKGVLGVRGTLVVPLPEQQNAFSSFLFEFANLPPLVEDLSLPPGAYFFVCSPSIVKSRGEVFLGSASAWEPARRSPNFFSDPGMEDLTNTVTCAQTVRMLTKTKPLADVTVMELIPGDESTQATVGFTLVASAPSYHSAGSCKYGPSSDVNAVVDERFRVHGVSHLRVVDSSVMPQLPSVNPVLTIAMLAERAADVIKEDHAN